MSQALFGAFSYFLLQLYEVCTIMCILIVRKIKTQKVNFLIKVTELTHKHLNWQSHVHIGPYSA